MEKSIEHSVENNTRCFACGSLVYAVEKKKTTNHIYHDRCFRCRICKRGLTGSTLDEEGDDIYCTNCYRKKQRGDCGSVQFQRAAAERAQYVYNKRHPDQPPPSPNPRAPIHYSRARHPSVTLHQLERRFLSYQEPNTKTMDDKYINYRKVVSVSHPLRTKTSFSSLGDLPRSRSSSYISNSESSPTFQFLPVFSPYTSSLTGSLTKTPKSPVHFKFNDLKINEDPVKPNVISGLKIQLKNNNTNLINTAAPYRPQKYSLNNQSATKKENQVFFPDTFTTKTTPARQRSSSATHTLHRRKFN